MASTAPALDEEPAGSGAMSDEELAQLCAQHENKSVGYYDSEIAAQQAKAINYYYGIMDDLPALDGCSSVVDHTVSVMVDNGLAAILKPFVSADEVVSFEPRSEEDKEQAEQATEYVNYVINCDNPGFLIFHDWFKDALLTKIGVVKAWWEDKPQVTEKMVGADAMQLEALRQDENYLGEEEGPGGVFGVRMQETIPDGRVKLVNVPPEEFLISPLARSIEDAPYVAHRPSNFTRSDLIEFGVDREIVDSLPAYSEGVNDESRSQARYRDQEYNSSASNKDGGGDPSRDIIGVMDEYVRCDYDGDGISELRRVVRVNATILLNEKVDDSPFALICPVPMPHKVYGRSVADLAIEGQKVSTAVTRQTLDNLYKSNNPRAEVPEGAVGDSTIDDLMDSAPGAVIRTKQGGLMQWSVVPFSADKSFGMLEYIQQGVEERTGIQRKGNGVNAEAIKKNSPDTATQAAIDENSRNERAEMIARIFAETGVKRLFKLILKLLVEHQPRERVIRLRNKWVPVDPRGWHPDMDLTISVGLGLGNKNDQITQAETVLATMERLSDTPYAHLVNDDKVINALKKLYNAVGIKNVEDFYAEPERDEQGNVLPRPAQPDPETMKVQAELQMKQADMQGRQQEAAMKLQLAQADQQTKAQLAQAQAQADLQLQRERAELEAQLARDKAMFEAELAREKFAAEQQMEERRMQMEERLAERDAARREREAESKMSKNREGGDLSK